MKAEVFPIEGAYNSEFFVYDSLLFVCHFIPEFTYFYDIYSLNDNSLIGKFCYLGANITQISYNESTGILYGKNFFLEDIYCYDLNQ